MSENQAVEPAISRWTERSRGPGVVALQQGCAVNVRLDRGEVHNAFDLDMTQAVSELVQEVAADPGVRAVLISGNGPSFSSGADLRAALDVDARRRIGEHLRRFTAPLILAIRNMPKPVVAAVHGNAVGAGCSLALACDYVIAAESASFHLAFSRVGLGMDGGVGATVSARAGFSVASAMTLMGQPIGGVEAAAVGLAEEVVPDDELADAAERTLVKLANGPTESYAATKAVLNRVHYADLEEVLALEADLQEQLLASEGFAETVAALLARREAQVDRRV